MLFSVLFYKYAMPLKQNSLQRKLRFLISVQLSTCESLSFEFELLPQIYKMQCLVLLMPECLCSFED